MTAIRLPAPACNAHVYWWKGEYDMNCERPEGHEGAHYDGLSWFNDENEEVIPDPRDVQAVQFDRAEAGRLALIQGIDSVADYADTLELAYSLNSASEAEADVIPGIVEHLRALVAAAHAEHRRVWGEGR